MGEPSGRAHRALLGPLIAESEPREAVATYLDRVADWGRRVNLTGARTPEQRVKILVRPVLAARQIPDAGPLIDIGAGSGSPGLVLALLRPDIEVELLEPRLRRWVFLREVARALGRTDIKVTQVRHSHYQGPPAQTATVRALKLPLAELAPLVAPQGRLIIFGRHEHPTAGFGEEGPPAAEYQVLRRVCST